MSSRISTFGRFIYLNIYAYLLLIIGVGISFLHLYEIHWLLLVIQIIAVVILLNVSIKIFKSWASKKRSYTVLMERNRNGIREETFKEYMLAPCGRLLVKIVLSDLGERHQYKRLRKIYSMTLSNLIQAVKESRKPKRTVVYIAGKKVGETESTSN